MKVQRLDAGRMDAPEKTSQGFLKVPAHLTRAGVLSYFNADGSERREWRPMSEVLKSDSLATLISAPVTDNHPPEAVTVANRAKYDRGNLGDNIVRDGGKVAATLYIKDGKLISAIERGDQREVSCGYTCDVEMGEGVVPDGEPDAGQRYDAIQRGISYNHVAAVPRGRAGSEVRMHLDSAGNQVSPAVERNEEKNMTKERIDGVDYEVGTEPHKAAVARRDEAEKARKADGDKLQARADKAEADLAQAKKDLAEAPAKIASAAKARADLLEGARKIMGESFKVDALEDLEVKRAIAAKANPKLKLDGKSAEYIETLYEAAIVAVPHADESDSDLGKLRADAEQTALIERETKIDADAAYERMVNRDLNRWQAKAKA